MTYKALNTFIDDIFAFVIKMPTMYRIGCFRDDVVFFIFLYQRYIYRVKLQLQPLLFHRYNFLLTRIFQVDYTRVNEFGISGDMLDESGSIKDTVTADAAGQIEDKSSQENGAPSQPKSVESKKKD